MLEVRDYTVAVRVGLPDELALRYIKFTISNICKQKTKEEEKMKNKLKKIFSLYNLAILLCVVTIIGSLIILFEPDFGKIAESIGITSEEKEISEKDARKLAKKQFKELGEKKLDVDDLKVQKIARQGEEYYYIKSEVNTLEIQIKTGKIPRVNSKVVE